MAKQAVKLLVNFLLEFRCYGIELKIYKRK